MNNKTVILNFSTGYVGSIEELLSSDGFRFFVSNYLKYLAVRDIRIYRWLNRGSRLEDMIDSLIRITKQLMILDIDEIYDPMLNEVNRVKTLYVVEDAYNYWRSKQRFSIMNSYSNITPHGINFMEADNRFEEMVLTIYRTCEEKLQGAKNRVYRQLNAGTNGALLLQTYKIKNPPSGYGFVKNIPFINTLMIRTPLLLHTDVTRREGDFEEVDFNPLKDSNIVLKDWLCYPCKVGDLLCFVYFHRDFMANAVSLANLFELASEEECVNRKADMICFYGVNDDRNRNLFYYDSDNDIWVGTASYTYKIEYFSYLKKLILTLHNVRKMQMGSLPIHGCMMNVRFKEGYTRSVIFVGDTDTGKSELVEMLKKINENELPEEQIDRLDVIFDDMGSLTGKEGKIYAQGTEIGAFVRLDSHNKGTVYRDMERSVFFNTEDHNRQLVAPISSYDTIVHHHNVDMILYCNNYDHKAGVRRYEDYSEAKKVFAQGKRLIINEDGKKEMNSSFFANPYGPMQQMELCSEIMDQVFGKLYDDGVYVGEIYTNPRDKECLEKTAREFMNALKEL